MTVRFLILTLLATSLDAAAASTLVFCCSASNDLYEALNRPEFRYDTPARAIERAPEGSAVFVLADDYPSRRTPVDESFFAAAARKNLRLYVEFPSFVPGVTFGDAKQAQWERLVVASDAIGPSLAKLRLLTAHSCTYLPVTSPGRVDAHVVLARVAGFDTAVYGLPKETHPILFALGDGKWLIATTRLSNFATARYAPAREWTALWQFILSTLARDQKLELRWRQRIRPALGPDEPFPGEFESRARRVAAEWYLNSGLLIHRSREAEIHRLLSGGAESELPGPGQPAGDGSLGIMEGYASQIHPDGVQPRRLPIRLDCNAESAMVLALESAISADLPRAKTVAANLLDYVHYHAPSRKGPRGDPAHPAYGLISWGEVAPAWTVANYGDDNARALLASIAAAAALGTDRYDGPILRALLANLRTTGRLGFRGDRIDMPELERLGWRHFADREIVNYAPPFESWLWACYLWAYARTGERAFLDKTVTAVRMTMENYPRGWRWQDNMERARMLLCLAWLVRVEDTPRHRQWLDTIAADLLKSQQPSGAIRERLAGKGGGHYVIPKSNEAYGTTETPLVHSPEDPATDQLYTTGFALLALHEAAGATNDQKLRKAEDALARYACRIQVDAPERPDLHGAWFRAFNDRDWEYWASSADAGWGAWCVEAGWGQAWAAATLALRQKRTTLWELTAGSGIRKQMADVKQEMLRNDGAPWKPQ